MCGWVGVCIETEHPHGPFHSPVGPLMLAGFKGARLLMDSLIRAGRATRYRSIHRVEESGFKVPTALCVEHVSFVSCGIELVVFFQRDKSFNNIVNKICVLH